MTSAAVRHPAASSSGICLATATTERFLPGAVAAVGSFVRHHPRFAGDIVVIHDGLSRNSREYLGALSERVRFEPVSPALRARLNLLPPVFRRFPGRQKRLYSLEAFRLTGYRKVLFCDADLLFRQPVDELFDTEAELLCCGDGAHLQASSRDAAASAGAAARKRTFNSGFMLVDSRLLGELPYADLLALVAPETWRNETAETHTDDQFVLNRYFGGRQTLVGWTYNYLMRFRDRIRAREGLSWRQAKVLHFNLPTKPWLSPDLANRPLKGLPLDVLPAFKLWHDAWFDCLTAAHLRSVRLDALPNPLARAGHSRPGVIPRAARHPADKA